MHACTQWDQPQTSRSTFPLPLSTNIRSPHSPASGLSDPHSDGSAHSSLSDPLLWPHDSSQVATRPSMSFHGDKSLPKHLSLGSAFIPLTLLASHALNFPQLRHSDAYFYSCAGCGSCSCGPHLPQQNSYGLPRPFHDSFVAWPFNWARRVCMCMYTYTCVHLAHWSDLAHTHMLW